MTHSKQWKDRPLLRSKTSALAPPLARQAQTTTQHDYTILAISLLVLIAITGLPFVYGNRVASGDRVFMGIVLDVPDTAQYFSWLRAHQTDLLVSNWMTPEPNQPAFFNLLWLLLGRFSQWTGLSFVLTFQVLRVVAGAAFGFTLFWLYGLLADSRRERWWATVLVLLGGGIGWVWVIEKFVQRRDDLLFPLDVQVAEPNALLSMIGYPHFLLAAVFMFAIFGLFLVGVRGRGWPAFGLAALLALLLGVQHAYDLLTIYCVLGGFVLLRWWSTQRIPWRDGFALVLIGVVSSPPAAYFTYLTSHDPIWRQVLAQFSNAGVFTPNPLHLLILLGPQLPLACLAVPRLLRRQHDNDLFLLSWLVIGFGLLYIPTDFQIHMLNPYQVPLALLAVRVALGWADAPKQLMRWAPVLLLLVAIPVNMYLFAWRFVDLRRQQPPYFLHRNELAAIDWLNQQPDHRVVLSDELLGQYVPALAGKHAVLAHWAQTVDYYGKRDAVAAFFNPTTAPSQRAALVKQFDVAYVLLGERERNAALEAALTPDVFERVFESPSAAVYRVRSAP